MLLENKNAIVYGSGGIAEGVAHAFAVEGATVHLAGRNEKTVEKLANEIRESGGKVETAIVDALVADEVNRHADEVAERAGSIDISFNLINHGDVQGIPMIEMDVEDYLAPVVNGVRTLFLTATAAARHMRERGSGVILIFGGAGDPMKEHSLGGLQTGFEAIESMRRQLATELGGDGIRVVTIRTGGIPDAIPDDFAPKKAIEESISSATILGRAATLQEVGDTAAFIASDKARSMTAATVNISAGALIDHQ